MDALKLAVGLCLVVVPALPANGQTAVYVPSSEVRFGPEPVVRANAYSVVRDHRTAPGRPEIHVNRTQIFRGVSGEAMGSGPLDVHRLDVEIGRRRRSDDAAPPPSTPAAGRTRLIAGDYQLSITSAVPPTCPTTLQLGGRVRLAQSGNAVSFNAHTTFVEQTMTGQINGGEFRYAFSETRNITPIATAFTFVGGGAATIQDMRIVGAFEGDITTRTQTGVTQFETKTCHVTGVPFVLDKAS